MPAYEAGGGGSSPPGSAQGWLAQWQSTRSTPGLRRFDSFAGYGGCGVEAASEAVNLRGRGQYPAITPRAGCSWVRQAVCKAAASAVGVRISPRPPCFHGPADRTPVSETGSRRFESSWKRAWHGTRWCGRQSAKLPLAGSTPARVSSVLTLWTAGDGWHLGESKLAGYLPPLMEWCGFESRPPDYPAVAQSAERFTIRCAPPTFARLPVVPGRRHRLRCGHGSKTAGYLSGKQKPSGSRYHIRTGTGGAAGRVEDGRLSRDRKS